LRVGCMPSERNQTLAAKRDTGIWTYGEAFRTTFAIVALIGIAGASLGGLRA
jgi:hypothetical protein